MRIAFLTALLFGAMAAAAQEPIRFEWKGDLAAGQRLDIYNINGDVKAEPADGFEAAITVQIQGTRPDPSTIRIDVVRATGGVTACTIYQGFTDPEVCTAEKGPSTHLRSSDVKVSYSVKVPAGVKLTVHTVNGGISAELPESEIRANTVNGRVTVSTGQAVEANVVNGSILASLAGVEWTGARTFHTVNGSIDVEVPAAVNGSVRASTLWGWITTDFPIRVWRGIVGSWVTGDLNQGGPLLEMTTVSGSVHLRKQAAE